jgi:hypothetical protein
MDLSTIRDKISTTYKSLEDLDRDVDLMVDNAASSVTSTLIQVIKSPLLHSMKFYSIYNFIQ